MKKLVLILLLFISIFSFSDESFTASEKNALLKQFTEFQKAVKNKDITSMKRFLDDSVYGIAYINEDSYPYEAPVGYSEITKNKAEFLEIVEDMPTLKVDLKNNTVKEYKNGYLTVSAEFYTWENDSSIFPAWLNDIYKPGEKIFEIYAYNDDPEYPSFSRYIFKVKENKLKFSSVTGGP